MARIIISSQHLRQSTSVMKLGIVSVLLGVVLVVAGVTTLVVWQADTPHFETLAEDIDPNCSDQGCLLMRGLLGHDHPSLTETLIPDLVGVGLFWLGVFLLAIGIALVGRNPRPREIVCRKIG